MNTVTPTQIALDDLLDNVFLHDLQNRPIARDSNGDPIRDDDGKLIYERHPAAFLQAVRGRLKDLGIDRIPRAGTTAAKLAEAIGMEEGEDPVGEWAKAHGAKTSLKISDFDHEDDAATA
jgi:hypothetical protein